jgi:peptidoglycan/LPS O-acetylase OafA/YrhL
MPGGGLDAVTLEHGAGISPVNAETPRNEGDGRNGDVKSATKTAKTVFQIPSLDGIRCLAVMIVIVSHLGLERYIPGNFGVTIFFFLSGYLITTLMRMEKEKTGKLALNLFYMRRAIRILPPFYLTLTLAWIATGIGLMPGVLHWTTIAAQALHVTNYWIVAYGWAAVGALGTWIFWSLAVEEHFYLVFPWVFLALQRLPNRRTQAFILWGICAAVLIWRLILIFVYHVDQPRLYVATDARFDSLLYGCALAIWGNPALDPTDTPEKIWKYLWFPLGLALIGLSFVVRTEWFAQSFRYTLQGIGLIPFYVVAIRYPHWAPIRPLNWKPVAWVGLISYSLYLVHPILIEAVHLYAGGSRLYQGILAFVISIATATAIYYGVEIPSGRLRKRLSVFSRA